MRAPGKRVIRPAGEEDLPAIQRIARAAYTKYVERIGREPAPMVADFEEQIRGQSVFVALEEATIRGFIVCFAKPSVYFVENVAVDPDWQGKGLGQGLLAFAEAQGRAAGLTRAELYTNVAMWENLALYPRLGWRETGRRRENGFDRVHFEKILRP